MNRKILMRTAALLGLGSMAASLRAMLRSSAVKGEGFATRKCFAPDKAVPDLVSGARQQATKPVVRGENNG